MTALPPSPFISNSADVVMLSADTAVALLHPPVAAAGPIPVSDGEASCSLPSGESGPSVTLAYAPSESIAESSTSTGGYQEVPAAPPHVAAGATDCIGEIFHYARLLIAEDNPNSCAGCQNLTFAYEGIDGGARYRCETCGESVYVSPGATSFPLDEVAFMDAIDEPPLFLRMAGH